MKEIDLGKFIVGLSKIKNECGLSVTQFNAIDKLALDCCKLKEIPALKTDKKETNLLEKIKQILKDKKYIIKYERLIPYGTELRLHNGTIILIYPHKNKYCFQGRNVEAVSYLLEKELGGEKNESDLKDITNSTIENTWYVKILKESIKTKETY